MPEVAATIQDCAPPGLGEEKNRPWYTRATQLASPLPR